MVGFVAALHSCANLQPPFKREWAGRAVRGDTGSRINRKSWVKLQVWPNPTKISVSPSSTKLMVNTVFIHISAFRFSSFCKKKTFAQERDEASAVGAISATVLHYHSSYHESKEVSFSWILTSKCVQLSMKLREETYAI